MAEYLQSIKIPGYTREEERFNAVSHFIGVVLSVAGFSFLMLKTLMHSFSVRNLLSSLIYGLSLILLFSGSSLYHYLEVNNKKRIMRVLDHCNVYVTISGSYTPFLLTRIYDYDRALAMKIFVIMWSIVAVCIVMTFINMDGLKELLHMCYVGMGVAIMIGFIPFGKVFEQNCLIFIFLGGIVSAIGAIMYGIGSKKRWFHSIFHVLVLISCIFFYCSIAIYLI